MSTRRADRFQRRMMSHLLEIFTDVLLSTPQEDGIGHLADYTIQTIVVVSLNLYTHN